MKKIYLENGGFPLTTKTIKHLADMTEQVAAVVSQMAGDNVIVSGVVEDNGSASDGWVVIAGELFPFVGGQINTHVRIVEEIEQSQYLKDDNNDGVGDFVDAYFNRYATFTAVTEGNIPFADFERYENLRGGVLKSGIAGVELINQTSTIISGNLQTITFKNADWQTANFFPFEVTFDELSDEYTVLINQVHDSDTFFHPIFFNVYDKTSTSFKFYCYALQQDSFSALGNSGSNTKFEINLIKK